MPPDIKHVIVLLLENRSFDHMFGFLDHPKRNDHPDAFLTYADDGTLPLRATQQIGGVHATSTARYRIDSPDHSHRGVMSQLLGGNNFERGWTWPFPQPYPTTFDPGYLRSYTLERGGDAASGARIMRCFHPTAIPVMATLAKQFALFTNWHCSVPGETWPNRDFAVAGTSFGRANQRYLPRPIGSSVFERLPKRSYRIYHDGAAHSSLYLGLAGKGAFSSITDLYDDIERDSLPSYSYVEPDYGLGAARRGLEWLGKKLGFGDSVGNSQHPSQAQSAAEFVAGEHLVASIYNRLRLTMDNGDAENSVFAKTLFLITYDEHGGFYDHAPPVSGVFAPHASDDLDGFKFDLLGPRVPAILVSPWIEPATLEPGIFDHASIPRTVLGKFNPIAQGTMGARVTAAKPFDSIAMPQLRPIGQLPIVRPLDRDGAERAMALHGATGGPETSAPDVELRKDWEYVIRHSDTLLPPSIAFSAAEAAANPEDYAVDVVARLHEQSRLERAQPTTAPASQPVPRPLVIPKPRRDAPARRPLKVFAFDPSSGTLLGNCMKLDVRYERLMPGPVVADRYEPDAIAVVDYDATNGTYYEPVDLDDPDILIRGGLDPVESDPRFHQQMVYAVATDTIESFEAALGRKIHWRRCPRDAEGKRTTAELDIRTLYLYPHAMNGANAYYSPQAHGILFGYFRAAETGQGRNLPGQTTYTCLSHDIIVHELTHAILDGMRRHFTERSNPDVAAFHEGFADLAALFRHFTHAEVLLDTIRRTGGEIYRTELAGDAARGASISAANRAANPLIQLARQFGEARGQGKALRDALAVPPDSTKIDSVTEAHERGGILVSAVFDAFFAIYLRRTKQLFQVFRAGGASASKDLPEPLAALLAQVASKTARQFFTLCVRAIDYCPPTDITFGDYLRALITSDLDVHPTDEDGMRDALLESFRLRGIVPDGAEYLTESAVAWPRADLPPIFELGTVNATGLTGTEKDRIGDALRAYVGSNWATTHGQQRSLSRALRLDPDHIPRVVSFHPATRTLDDGSIRIDLVVELVQELTVQFDPSGHAFPMRGGATLIVTLPSIRERNRCEGLRIPCGAAVRYAITKTLDDARARRQREHYKRLSLDQRADENRFSIDFALMHEEP